jgi:hypothetical protein
VNQWVSDSSIAFGRKTGALKVTVDKKLVWPVPPGAHGSGGRHHRTNTRRTNALPFINAALPKCYFVVGLVKLAWNLRTARLVKQMYARRRAEVRLGLPGPLMIIAWAGVPLRMMRTRPLPMYWAKWTSVPTGAS